MDYIETEGRAHHLSRGSGQSSCIYNYDGKTLLPKQDLVFEEVLVQNEKAVLVRRFGMFWGCSLKDALTGFGRVVAKLQEASLMEGFVM